MMSVTSEKDFWDKIQNPLTRLSDPSEILRGAIYALDAFEDSRVTLASSAIICYRYMDLQEPMPEALISKIAHKINSSIEKNKAKESSLINLRWELSANMAFGTYWAAIGSCAEMNNSLKYNVSTFHTALLHGQPFTNVVKSYFLGGILNIAFKNQEGIEFFLENTGIFLSAANRIPANYIINNEFALEELALVYRILENSLKISNNSKSHDLAKINLLSINNFEWKFMGNIYLQIVKKIYGQVSS